MTDNDEWIKWTGGENPVPGKKVIFRLRGELRTENQIKDGIANSDNLFWDEFGDSSIVAYRVIEEEQKTVNATIFKHDDFTKIVDSTIEEIKKLAELKGGEYAGDTDRLANFRRNGDRLGLLMETVWAVYAGKHIDAVFQYVQDLQTGKTRTRLEGIEGRVDDIIVYMLLFKAMIQERKNG